MSTSFIVSFDVIIKVITNRSEANLENLGRELKFQPKFLRFASKQFIINCALYEPTNDIHT